MAGLRKGHCYSRIQRSYTRKSKFKGKDFVKGSPVSKEIRFDMGDVAKKYSDSVNLVSLDAVQIRHNALESARQVVNRQLNEYLGNNYYYKIHIYPHHVLRENKMLTGAGADRMQTGMQQAFGFPVGIAAQVRKKQTIMSVRVDAENVEKAKQCLKKALPRIPGHFKIVISKIV